MKDSAWVMTTSVVRVVKRRVIKPLKKIAPQ